MKSVFSFIFFIFILQSCATRKEVEYFNNIKIGSQDKIIHYPNKIQINDILYITVGELLSEAVEPFNKNTANLESSQLAGYLVSFEGKIVFPRIGKISVIGKTTTETEEIISKLLIDKGLIKEPIVSVRIINSRVTVIGEGVNSQIVSFGANNTLTILQAVGSIAPTGIKNDIVLIREEDGIRTYRKLDITSIDLINSPYYYLKQNDVIYVKPNGPAVLLSGWLTSPGAIFGVLSSLIGLYFITKAL